MIEKLFFYHFFTLIIFQFFFIWEWGRANRYAIELMYISLGLLLLCLLILITQIKRNFWRTPVILSINIYSLSFYIDDLYNIQI